MSRIVRLGESPQATLPLGHGPVHWDTLSPSVRERVLALWMQLLTEHLSRATEHTADAIATASRLSLGGEDGR